jgi:hypothetical protein
MSTAKMTAAAKAAQGKLVTEAKRRIKRVGTAAKQLEDDLKWIANNKAWDLLGYGDFPSMFEGENGYSAPDVLRVWIAKYLREEGMNSRVGRAVAKLGADGHRVTDVAKMAGFPVRVGKGGYEVSTATSEIFRQLDDGVHPADVRRSVDGRRRQQLRRPGKAHNELVQEGFGLLKEDATLAGDMAREAGISKSELYRKWVQPHIDAERLKRSRRTSRSRGKAA